jgi:hypothetical protein
LFPLPAAGNAARVRGALRRAPAGRGRA